MEEMRKTMESIGAFQAVQRIVLASASPRRRELLSQLGLGFSILTEDGAEPLPCRESPASYAVRAATAKALAVADRLARNDTGESPAQKTLPVVIGADTIVVLPGPDGPEILGKPKSDQEALSMLIRLAGREHQVCTGCCIVWPCSTSGVQAGQDWKDGQSGQINGDGPHGARRIESFHDTARVTFAAWPESALAAYVRTGEGRDKAGSYAIQGKGAFLVERIDGQWSTIVGLPVQTVTARLLQGGAITPVASTASRVLSRLAQ